MSLDGTRLFPVIRPVSRPFSRLLIRLPLSANQVTAMSLIFGLLCNWCFLQGDWELGIVGGVFFVFCYIFDNSDGDVARAKNQCSDFGMHFDTFVDWVVHATFFPALGYGYAGVTGETWWIWLGWIGFGGSTINYLLGLYIDFREKRRQGAEAPTGHEAPGEAKKPEAWHEWAVYVFRELTRADFCFIVLALAVFDVAWVLIPAGAIGSQVYWMGQFVKGANEYHV